MTERVPELVAVALSVWVTAPIVKVPALFTASTLTRLLMAWKSVPLFALMVQKISNPMELFVVVAKEIIGVALLSVRLTYFAGAW